MSNREYMEDIRENEFEGSEDVVELDPTIDNHEGVW
jgi:hypothetical protein